MTSAPLLLLTQADAEELASGSMDRLLDSIRAASPQRGSASVVVTLRGVPADATADLLRTHADLIVRVVDVPHRTSLSSCRNAGLQAAASLLQRPDLLVAFPDDDLWFPVGLLDEARRIVAETGADVVCGRYAPDTDVALPDVGIAPGWLLPAATARLSCNAFFMTAALVVRLERFNEQVGAGTRIPAGEDLDLLLRAVAADARVWYSPELRFLHAWRVHHDYLAASTTVLAAHVLAGTPRLRGVLLRVVLHAFRGTLQRSLPSSVLLDLVRMARARSWRLVASGWPQPDHGPALSEMVNPVPRRSAA